MTIEDHEAIRDLMYRFCHYADSADGENWASLFTEDGWLDVGMPSGPIAGRDALRAFCAAITPGMNLHVTANPVITVDGDDATVASYMIIFGDHGDPRVLGGGPYQDRLLRVDGKWLFVSRLLDPQLRFAPAPTPAS